MEEKKKALKGKELEDSMEKYRQELLADGWKEDSREFGSLMALHKHLVATDPEELEREFKEIEDSGIGANGPTVEEYFQGINPQYQYVKGYQEGALRFKELLEGKIQEILEVGKSGRSPSTYSIPEVYQQHVLPLIKEVYENN